MRIAVVGGGIVGLATARQLVVSRPGAEVVLFEKEDALAAHQSGHNSGVLHAGVYYTPGSDKAVLCTRGRRLMVRFCAANDVPTRTSGKVIVARDAQEEAGLADLLERAVANRVPDARLVGPEELAEIEPAVNGVRALHSPATGVVDFSLVAERLAALAAAQGAEVRRGTPVEALRPAGDGVMVVTAAGAERFDAAVACPGLGSDRLAVASGFDASPAIVPFRGGYVRLRGAVADRVRSLVYPVPDPRYPFLGVHLTRTIDDEVLVGPNALLALAREEYGHYGIDGDDVAAMLRWPGFWRLAAEHWPAGLRELVLATSRRLYLREVASYVPAVTAEDLEPSWFGIRAQAVARDGSLVDDFAIDHRGPVVLVRNAPSPAATSSIALGERLVSLLLGEEVLAPEADD